MSNFFGYIDPDSKEARVLGDVNDEGKASFHNVFLDFKPSQLQLSFFPHLIEEQSSASLEEKVASTKKVEELNETIEALTQKSEQQSLDHTIEQEEISSPKYDQPSKHASLISSFYGFNKEILLQVATQRVLLNEYNLTSMEQFIDGLDAVVGEIIDGIQEEMPIEEYISQLAKEIPEEVVTPKRDQILFIGVAETIELRRSRKEEVKSSELGLEDDYTTQCEDYPVKFRPTKKERGRSYERNTSKKQYLNEVVRLMLSGGRPDEVIKKIVEDDNFHITYKIEEVTYIFDKLGKGISKTLERYKRGKGGYMRLIYFVDLTNKLEEHLPSRYGWRLPYFSEGLFKDKPEENNSRRMLRNDGRAYVNRQPTRQGKLPQPHQHPMSPVNGPEIVQVKTPLSIIHDSIFGSTVYKGRK